MTTKLKEIPTAIEISGADKEIITPETPVSQIDSWIEMRKNFSQKVVSIMVEGKDYHKLNFRGKEVQVLAKGGAEKVASALGWVAEFTKDTETYEMLGSPAGTLCYICNLRNGEFKGQGRGARNVKQDAGDINKTIKMAQKSAFIDAVLRASGLSDLFTQDLEQEEVKPEPKPYAHYPKPVEPKPEFTSPELFNRLSSMVSECNTLPSLDLVAKDIQIAFNNKKISPKDYALLKASGGKKREELSK